MTTRLDNERIIKSPHGSELNAKSWMTEAPLRMLMNNLSSRRGDLICKVDTKGRNRTPQGLVFIPWFDAGRLVNKLTLDATDPLSKETDYKKCAVKVARA